MTFEPIPTASIAAMIVSILLCIGFPLALVIVLKKRCQAKLSFFLGGCICFPVFVIGLESLLHRLVLTGPWGTVLQQNIWLYALYGGLAAGIFEEFGRFAFLSVLTKKDSHPQNALMFGAGHGGIEAVLLLVSTYINNIIYSVMINAGQIDSVIQQLDDATRTVFVAQLAALPATAPGLFLIGGIERLLAMTLHIALSVVVFTAIRRKQFGYVLLAVALHALVDGVTVLVATVVPVALLEIVVLILVALISLYASKLYRGLREEDSEE